MYSQTARHRLTLGQNVIKQAQRITEISATVLGLQLCSELAAGSRRSAVSSRKQLLNSTKYVTLHYITLHYTPSRTFTRPAACATCTLSQRSSSCLEAHGRVCSRPCTSSTWVEVQRHVFLTSALDVSRLGRFIPGEKEPPAPNE
jgi:hypothetical protein